MPAKYEDNVFINCPFDDEYRPIFNSIVFAVHDAGFIARCALEIRDATQNRLDKIMHIVSECKYGIHDISRTELDQIHKLPRFNMPLELGIFLGCKRFGNGIQKAKFCMVIDREPHRYQKFISDIAGQDIDHHNGSPKDAIKCVRNWLRQTSERTNMPGAQEILRRYNLFQQKLPSICDVMRIQVNELTFVDFAFAIAEFLKEVEKQAPEKTEG